MEVDRVPFLDFCSYSDKFWPGASPAAWAPAPLLGGLSSSHVSNSLTWSVDWPGTIMKTWKNEGQG